MEHDNPKIDVTSTLPPNAKSLEMLFDYTKFHIGLYLTLTASYIAVASIKIGESFAVTINHRLMWPAVVCFMIAGLAGGVIASSITQTQAPSALKFLDEAI